jgi:hypothetical protein
MAYTDVLPDPNNLITDSGKATLAATGGGEGFASVSLSSKSPVLFDQTNSGRVVSRAIAQQTWSIDIGYNPMTRAQFEPVYNFILQRGRLTPFYVSLPQNRAPQNATFSGYVDGPVNLFPTADTSGGSRTLLLANDSGDAGTDYVVATHNTPQPGDLFNVSDSNHNKTYRVTRVETASDYTGTQPGTNQIRIQFTPGLSKAVTHAASGIVFWNPLVRVLLKDDVQQYSLNADGLYSFSLKLQEAL